MKRATWRILGCGCTAAALLLVAGCATPSGTPSIERQSWGTLPDGTPVDLYILRQAGGVEARISNYGGIVTSLIVPDRAGRLGDVVLGHDSLDGYLRASPYFGCLIGRYGNRIAAGRFTLDGVPYTLAVNNGPNHLHGGDRGFDKRVWKARARATLEGPRLSLTYVSPDGEEGYPGTLTVEAVYTLTRQNGLRLDFIARTDRPTIVNLTQHSYFNLAGRGDVLGHVVHMPASRFTPVDSTLIPTGELRPVAGTPFDFRTPTTIAARVHLDDEQLRFGGGYDHNWVFDKRPGQWTRMARVTEPASGRILDVWSTAPGLQFYGGNFLDGTIVGKDGQVYGHRHGFCMEPQHFPDSPNRPGFPSVVLRPGQTYLHSLEYRFSTQ
ncbi:MAG: galactose mutarotase [Verrucomicrobiae bacterium]|nr:galactose mutarotase [Verrucomicrobiae bacterium]